MRQGIIGLLQRLRWTDTSSGEEKGSAHGNIWGIEYNYLATTPKSSSHQFGFTIRCVKE